MPQSLAERLAAVATKTTASSLESRLARVAAPVTAPTVERPYVPPAGPGQRGSTNPRDPIVTPPLKTINQFPVQALDLANRGLEIIQTPLRKAKEGIAAIPDLPISPTSKLYPIAAGVSEATRRSLDVAASMFLDPINLPFLAVGVNPSAVRPALRLGADALMFAVQETGAAKDLNDYRKTKDPKFLESAAMQQAFALMGAAGLAKERKIAIAREATRKDTIRREAEIKSDLGRIEAEKRRIAAREEAKASPNQAARRKTLEVPETVTPEDPLIRFTEAELEALTAPVEPLAKRLERVAIEPEKPVVSEAARPVESMPTVQPEIKSAIPAETKPAPTETKAAKTKPKPSAPKSFIAEVNRLHDNPVRSQDPQTLSDSQLTGYLRQLRNAVTRSAPELSHRIDAAEAALSSGDTKNFYLETENVVTKLHAKASAMAEAQLRKIKAKEEIEPATLEDWLIQDNAKAQAKIFAESVRAAQEQLRSGESAMTMESNAIGKEWEEAVTARAKSIKSLGVKEGSALAKFPETPGLIAAAIEKESGPLYQRVLRAFERERGDYIRESVDKLADEQKLEFFGSDYINIVGGKDKPLLARTEQEAASLAAGGRRPEQLKQGKIFDDTRIVESELFQGTGGKQKTFDEDISFDFGENVKTSLSDNAIKVLDAFEAGQKKVLGDLMRGGTKDVVSFTSEALARVVAIGAAKLARGTIKFSKWAADMVEDFGEGVRPHLPSIWEQSTQRMEPLRGLSALELSRLPDSIVEHLANTGQIDPVSKVIISLERASTARARLERAYTKERAKRAETLDTVMAKQSGQIGHFEALGKLKGEMAADKKNFEPLKLDQAGADNLFRQIQAHPEMSVFDKVATGEGLMMLLNGQVPPKSRIELLDVVFGPELAAAIREKRPWTHHVKSVVQQGVDLSKSLLSSFDMSAAFRQAAPFTLNVTKIPTTARAFGQMFRHVFSQKNFEAWLDAAKDDPMYELMKESGLHLADPRRGDAIGREEKYPSGVAERLQDLPIIKSVPILREAAQLYSSGIRASNRAYSGFLNKLRFDVYKSIAKDMLNNGIKPEENIKEFESLASFVNNATGRGELGKYGEQIVPFLNAAFFSPRLIAARFNMLNPKWYFKQTPTIRREAVKTMAGFIGTGMTVLALAKASGAQVETDPRSTDFGKIRIGNSRWDIWGGYQQWVRSLAQIISGYRKTSRGDLHKLSATEFPFETRKDVAERFFMSKLAPVPQLGYELMQGQKLFGDKITVEGELYENAVPFYLQDMKEAVIEMGPSAILSVGAPAFFGIGTQTYKERPPTGAIHSQIAGELSEPVTDVLMKNQVSVGRVERQTKTESAEVLRLRTTLTGKLINQFVAEASEGIDLIPEREERQAILRKATSAARTAANNIAKSAAEEETEAKKQEFLKAEINLIRTRR